MKRSPLDMLGNTVLAAAAVLLVWGYANGWDITPTADTRPASNTVACRELQKAALETYPVFINSDPFSKGEEDGVVVEVLEVAAKLNALCQP